MIALNKERVTRAEKRGVWVKVMGRRDHLPVYLQLVYDASTQPRIMQTHPGGYDKAGLKKMPGL